MAATSSHIPGLADNPPNPNAVKVVECGSCSSMHRLDFHGDCRDDRERFADPEDAEAKLGVPVVEVSEEP